MSNIYLLFLLNWVETVFFRSDRISSVYIVSK